MSGEERKGQDRKGQDRTARCWPLSFSGSLCKTEASTRADVSPVRVLILSTRAINCLPSSFFKSRIGRRTGPLQNLEFGMMSAGPARKV